MRHGLLGISFRQQRHHLVLKRGLQLSFWSATVGLVFIRSRCASIIEQFFVEALIIIIWLPSAPREAQAVFLPALHNQCHRKKN